MHHVVRLSTTRWMNSELNGELRSVAQNLVTKNCTMRIVTIRIKIPCSKRQKRVLHTILSISKFFFNVCSREFAGGRRCSCRISFKIQSNEKFFEIKISRDGFLNSIENFSIEKLKSTRLQKCWKNNLIGHGGTNSR